MDGVLALWRWPVPSLRGAVRLTVRNLVLYRRAWWGSILPNFLEPLLYLASIGVGLSVYVGQAEVGADYVVFIAPGLAAAAAMNGAIFEATYNVFVKLRFSRLYDAVVATPLEPEDIVAGELLWAMIRSTVYGGVFLLILTLLGHARASTAVLSLVAFPLIGLVFALAGMIYTSLVPYIDAYAYFFTLFIVPQFLFSGIFFPIEQLPAAVQPLAWLAPLHHGVTLCRALILDGDLGSAAGDVLWLVAVAALLFPPATNMLRRKLVQ